MFFSQFYVLLALCAVFFSCSCQEYDFAAEMTRQCLVPDPVGLVDCVEAKVTVPYLTSWVECTNSLGQNVKTSTDIINYRCKSVWEGKPLIPEVFYIKDCVIEKTGLPAKNVSAEVLGAYKECESTPSLQQQSIKTTPIQQQQLRGSSVEYKPPAQSLAPIIKSPQPMQVQIPIQQVPASVSFQPQNVAPRQQLQPARPLQPRLPIAVQQQVRAPVLRPVQQVPSGFVSGRPAQLTQQQVYVPLNPQSQLAVSRPQYPGTMPAPPNTATRRQPFSQQFFAIYPQPPLPNQQQRVFNPILSQKTAFVPQQQILASSQQTSSINPNIPYSYSFQINHPPRPIF